jgi:L-2-hydroxyglutarate oxidase
MREREPHVGGIEALLVPEEGIVDYPAACRTLAALIARAGGEVRTNAGVTALRREGAGWVAATPRGEVAADVVVGCAGLHADSVARMAGLDPGVRIVPFRGEYYKLRPERQGLVRHLIYPVPDPRFPFLGVHFTRLVGGGVEAGPNAVLAMSREGYTARDVDLRELAGIFAYPGMMRFMKRYSGAVVSELRQSFSKSRFAASLQKLVPEVTTSDLERGGAGVRAQALRPDGTLEEDFAFAETRGAVFVINAPSPAATASLAIGSEIAARVTLQLE